MNLRTVVLMGLYKVCKKHDAGEFWIEYGCIYHRLPMSHAVTYTQVSTACCSTYLLRIHSLTSGKRLSAGWLCSCAGVWPLDMCTVDAYTCANPMWLVKKKDAITESDSVANGTMTVTSESSTITTGWRHRVTTLLVVMGTLHWFTPPRRISSMQVVCQKLRANAVLCECARDSNVLK